MALLARGDTQRFVAARKLVPDLVDGSPGSAELLARLASFEDSDAPLVDVLLDQRIASGIGNVHAQEALFAERLHPLTPWRPLSDDVVCALSTCDRHARPIAELTACALLHAAGAGRPAIWR